MHGKAKIDTIAYLQRRKAIPFDISNCRNIYPVVILVRDVLLLMLLSCTYQAARLPVPTLRRIKGRNK
jgi:hypothetical protein